MSISLPQNSQSIRRAMREVNQWFSQQQQKPFAYQRDCWRHFLSARHGLIHAKTGTGKTLAAFLGAAIEALSEVEQNSPTKPGKRRQRKERQIQVLWITPLRALAGDTETNLRRATEGLGLDWVVERRTADTSSTVRGRQNVSLPEVLITTPESLTLLLTRPDAAHKFARLRLIVVDEWHELLGTKRGVQTELALARLRTLQSRARIWGVSATLGNLDLALRHLVGPQLASRSGDVVIVQGKIGREVHIETLLPENIQRFPWAGHIGQTNAARVANIVRSANSSLVFTNTRSQCEIWYRAILAELPELAGQLAVHHGSLDQKLRWWVEEKLREGKLRCCVCTSSLELGVDFPKVDRVIQVGSPKNCVRLLQRAGRSNHRPGQASHITFVPTHALELVEIAALKRVLSEGHLESRQAIPAPLDVLAQHIVSMALADGFVPHELLTEVRQTATYERLTEEEWRWVIEFAEKGGSSLAAYPDYHRIKLVADRYCVTDQRIARLHRLNIGTIVSDAAMPVRFLKGKTIGTVEESFVSRLRPGDRFTLGGRLLELVHVHDEVAWVKRGRGAATATARWMGSRMPLSSELSFAIRQQLDESDTPRVAKEVMAAVRPLIELQKSWSAVPAHDELLIERWHNRDGHHLFVYPFEGRLVHEGLAALWAYRLARHQPISFSMAMNDYGFVLVSPQPAPLDKALTAGLLSADNVSSDILATLNASEMSKRHFREIARIAGLIFQGYPGQRKLTRHLQASSNLFFDVFREYDPNNLLLRQSMREMLDQQFEEQRLINALQRLQSSRLIIMNLERPTPMAFPLVVDRLRDRLSSESFLQRVERLQASLEQAANRQQISQAARTTK